MKNYKLEFDSYELSVLKYLVYERNHLLEKKLNEVPESIKPGILKSYKDSRKLLIKLVNVSKDSKDFFNFGLLEREDKPYNEYIKEHFNAKS